MTRYPSKKRSKWETSIFQYRAFLDMSFRPSYPVKLSQVFALRFPCLSFDSFPLSLLLFTSSRLSVFARAVLLCFRVWRKGKLSVTGYQSLCLMSSRVIALISFAFMTCVFAGY